MHCITKLDRSYYASYQYQRIIAKSISYFTHQFDSGGGIIAFGLPEAELGSLLN